MLDDDILSQIEIAIRWNTYVDDYKVGCVNIDIEGFIEELHKRGLSVVKRSDDNAKD